MTKLAFILHRGTDFRWRWEISLNADILTSPSAICPVEAGRETKPDVFNDLEATLYDILQALPQKRWWESSWVYRRKLREAIRGQLWVSEAGEEPEKEG